MTYMKPQSKFLAQSLDEAFGSTIKKMASAELVEVSHPVVNALTDMDKAAEILESIGLSKAAGKVVKVMDKVSKKMKKKSKKEAKKTKEDKNVE